MCLAYALCCVAFALRVYARLKFGKRKLNWSDYWTSLAWVFVTIGTFVELARVLKEQELGRGRADNLDSIIQIMSLGGPDYMYIFNSITELLKLAFVGVHFSLAALWCVKAGLLSIYFELSLHLSKKIKIALWVTAIYCAFSFVTVLFLHIFMCMPVSRNWTFLDNFCSSYMSPPFFITFLVVSLTSDLMLVIIPSVIIRSLHLQTRERYAFLFVVVVGSISIVSSIMRFTVIYVGTAGLEFGKGSGDTIAIWGMIEMSSAFIACCLPSMRAFIRRDTPEKHSKDASYGSSNYGSRYGLKKKENLGNIPLNSYVEVQPDSNSETELYRQSEDSRVHRPKTSIASSV
ncbi:hypothetical protein RUND412_002826 [Rhizina undulata]